MEVAADNECWHDRGMGDAPSPPPRSGLSRPPAGGMTKGGPMGGGAQKNLLGAEGNLHLKQKVLRVPPAAKSAACAIL